MRHLRLEGLEDRITPTTNVWTGLAAQSVHDMNWSNPSNWSDGAPQSGQDLVFPIASSSNFIPTQAIVNDLTGMSFDSIEIDAPGYSIGGDAITLTAPTGVVTTFSSGVSTLSLDTDLVGGSVSVANGGELDIDGVVSGNAGFSLSGGGILGGDGQLTQLTVQGSEVTPGILGVGDLTVLASAAFNQSSTFSASINSSGGSNTLDVLGGKTSTVSLGSPALSISLAPGYTPPPGTAFTIIEGNVTGTFSGLPDGADVSVGGTTFRVSYDQGVVLTAVEPTTVQTSVLNGTTSSVSGQSVTFAATVSAAAGTPTGSVTFEDGGSVLGTAAVNASGVATFTTANLTLGQHAITSVYGGSADFSASTSPVLIQTVGQANTNTTFTSTANPSVLGQNVSFTAEVAAVPPGGGTPTGSVAFFDGTTELGDSPIHVGVATFSTSTLTLGSHPITAVYSGDTDFSESTSAVVNQDVNRVSTITTVRSSANPSVFGQSETFTAQVAAAAPGTGTPTGSITFFDGTTELGTIALTAGVAAFSTSNLTRGSHSITGVYSGDADSIASTSAVDVQVVDQATTVTTVASSPNASNVGQSITFTAQVAAAPPGAGTPTGSVTFFDGTSGLGTVALNAGSATFSTSALSLGSHSITALYNGDGDDFIASTSKPSLVQVGGSTVALVSSPDPGTFGQSVAFTATVAAAVTGGAVPTGSVTFMDGTQILGISTLDTSGVAHISTTKLSGGTHSITAVYGGDFEFTSSTSSASSEVVNPVSTITLVSRSVDPSTFGQSVTLTATVIGAVGTPTGSVTFKDGSTALGSASLDASGTAIFSSSALTVGAHALVAVYNGSGSYATSASSNLALSVDQATTTTILTGSTSTPAVGQSVTFTATVAAVAPGAGSPTGMVAFHDGSTVIGTALVSGGHASLTVPFAGVGSTHVIEATYLGSVSFLASGSASQEVTVVQGIATTTLIAKPFFVGATARGVTFQVVVQAGSTGAPVPGGLVTFEINRHTFRTRALVGGSASLFVSTRSALGRSFRVRYHGDTDYKAGLSNHIAIRARFFRPSLPK